MRGEWIYFDRDLSTPAGPGIWGIWRVRPDGTELTHLSPGGTVEHALDLNLRKAPFSPRYRLATGGGC